MTNLPPEVRHAFEHLKNETPLNMDQTESCYAFIIKVYTPNNNIAIISLYHIGLNPY